MLIVIPGEIFVSAFRAIAVACFYVTRSLSYERIQGGIPRMLFEASH